MEIKLVMASTPNIKEVQKASMIQMAALVAFF